MSVTKEYVEQVLDSIASRYRGPGGALAVLKDGELIGQRVWGFANLEQRIPLEAKTLLPICSTTKQFVCALLIDLERNPPPKLADKTKGDVRKQISDKVLEIISPKLAHKGELTIDRLVNMQSGLRDYWIMTTLWGAQPEDEFLIHRDAAPAFEKQTKSFHFEPGTEFSYCNSNFYIVARAIEQTTGEPLGKLLQERIIRPAGMETAILCPNTAEQPPPCVGYEGDEKSGFIPVVNRIEWSGDAGLVASLTDMIAYEKYLDGCYSDPESWYHTAIKQPTFKDGSHAQYSYGLGHTDIEGVKSFGHGGALRGYRTHRCHVPTERLSVIVLFNNEADAEHLAKEILRDVLGSPKPAADPSPIQPSEEWFGTFLEEYTQLAIVVTKASQDGEVVINFDTDPSSIKLSGPKKGSNNEMVATIDGDSLRINRIDSVGDKILTAQRIVAKEPNRKGTDLPGVYYCDEIESTFHWIGEAGTFYGAFDGYLGKGHATPMRYLGADVWALSCPRSLDAPAPGDWTVVLRRDVNSAVTGFTIGCWGARRIEFIKKT
jgi:CubicO group peptidase (beta-lactamase class C family)